MQKTAQARRRSKRSVCGGLKTVSCNVSILTLSLDPPSLRIRCWQCIVVGSQWTTMTREGGFFVVLFNGFMSLTSDFDVMYRY